MKTNKKNEKQTKVLVKSVWNAAQRFPGYLHLCGFITKFTLKINYSKGTNTYSIFFAFKYVATQVTSCGILTTWNSSLLTNTAAGLWAYISLRKLRLGQADRESFKMQGIKAKCKFKQNSRKRVS